MKPTGVVVTITLLLSLIALCGCGQQRPSARPPPATLTIAVADSASRLPFGEMVDLVFEILDEEPVLSAFPHAWIPPYRVDFQLIVLAHVNRDFFAQGTWCDRQITVSGVVRPVDEKTGAITLTLTLHISTVSGSEKTQTKLTTGLHLKPHSPIQLGGGVIDTNGDRRNFTQVIWARPHVTTGPDAPLLQQP